MLKMLGQSVSIDQKSVFLSPIKQTKIFCLSAQVMKLVVLPIEDGNHYREKITTCNYVVL